MPDHQLSNEEVRNMCKELYELRAENAAYRQCFKHNKDEKDLRMVAYITVGLIIIINMFNPW